MYIMTNVLPPPVNTAIIIFFTKTVLIKSKYELIYSTHNLIVKRCSSYEASICVGFQYKGSSIVALGNSSRGVPGIYRAHIITKQLLLGLYQYLNFLNFSITYHIQEVEPIVELL